MPKPATASLGWALRRALFGFVGLLIAVPAAAAVAVLVRFAINRYLESPLYVGHPADEPEIVAIEVKETIVKPRRRARAAGSKANAPGK